MNTLTAENLQQYRAANKQITHCPPMPAAGITKERLTVRGTLPVSVRFGADGIASPGLAFQDIQRMSTHKARGMCNHREIPAFMLNPKKLREIIVMAVEAKVFSKIALPDQRRGSLAARLKRAESKLLSKRARKVAVLDSLCERWIFARSTGNAYARKLAVQIEALDTQLCFINRPAAIISSVLFLSYRVGMDSVSVSQHLGCCKPPFVRQVLRRCRILAGCPPLKPRRLSPEERALRLQMKEDQKTARLLLRAKNSRASRAAAGLCTHCGEKPEPGYKTCAVFREYDRQRIRVRKKR